MNTEQRANVIPLNPPGTATAATVGAGALFQGIPCEKPPRPDWIGEAALEHWDYITDELLKTGQISRLDKGSLEILCISYARMREAEEAVARDGEFQTFGTGATQLSPMAVAFQRHASRYQKLTKEFGLTVRARKQMDLRDPNQADLPL